MTELIYFLLGSFLTIAVGLYFAGRNSLAYLIREFTVLGPKEAPPQELQITFAGRPVSSLVKIELALWNSGNTTVQDSEVEDTVRWTFSNRTILQTDVCEASHSGVSPSASSDERSVEVQFKYLNKRDWVYVTVFAVPDTRGRIAVDQSGNIRGITKVRNKSGGEVVTSSFVFNLIIIVPMILFILAFSLVGLLSSGQELALWHVPLPMFQHHQADPNSSPRVGLAVSSFFLFIGVVGLWFNLRELIVGLTVPASLRKRLSR